MGDMITEFLNEEPKNPTDNDDRNKHDEVKEMIEEFLESSDEETDKKDDPLPGLPEELLRNLPPEMAESLKKNYDQSMRDIAKKEVEKSEQTVSKVTEVKIETEVNKSVQEKEKDSKRQLETEVTSKKADDVEDEEDVSLPPTPAVSTPWSEIAARPERPSGPTPAESEEHERKNSGPFSSRKLFSDDRDPSSVSPEIIEAANETVNKVIDEAKERVTQITKDENSTTVIKRFDEVQVSVDRSTTEEDIFIRDQTRSTTDSGEPGKLPSEERSSGGEVFDWRDDKDGATGLKEKLEGEAGEGETTQKVIYAGKLQITVVKAEELEKMDMLQKADPYVNIKYGSQLSKSKKKKNTLTPEWNHKVDLSLEGEGLEEVQIEVMDWERLGKDEPMGKVSLPVEDAVSKSSEGGFWLNLKDCKSGKVMVSTEFSGTKTLRTVTQRITESSYRKESRKTETSVASTSVSSEHQTKTKQEDVAEQEQVPTIGKGDQGDNIQAENKKQSSKKETAMSWKDDDDGAQGLKSSLLKDDKKETSDRPEEDTTNAGNTQKEKQADSLNWKDDKDGIKGLETLLLDKKSEKEGNVSNSTVVEVAKSTVTKVIKDAQQKVAEDTTIKPSTEDDAKSDPEENKEIMTEKDERPAKEKQLDWKDDEDGAQGLKSQLLEDKKDEPVDVLTVAKETVTKVIEDAKKKVAEKSSGRTSPIEDGGDKEQEDVATEKDEASRESIPDWRDDKDGAQGLKSKLLDDKSDQESTKESGEKSNSSKLEKDAMHEMQMKNNTTLWQRMIKQSQTPPKRLKGKIQTKLHPK